MRTAKEERAPCQLADVQHIPRKEQPLAEDRRKQVGVFTRAHRAQEHDLRTRTDALRERRRCSLERGRRGGRSLATERVSLEVLDRDGRVRGNQPIGHGDDADPVARLARAREGTSVLEFSSKVQAAEKAEDIAKRNAPLSEPAGE